MERANLSKAHSIFEILEPTLLNKFCHPRGENSLAVVDLDTLKPDDAAAASATR
jgi:hypothetical protein